VTPVSEQPTDRQDGPEDVAGHPPRRAVPAPPVTGDAVLDGATGRLAQAAALPLDAQVEAFEQAHRALESRLADVES
jgi:hypothetical protein